MQYTLLYASYYSLLDLTRTFPTLISYTHPLIHLILSHISIQVIMATNKIEALDPALIRPGRIDRKIEFPLPDIKTKRNIFKIHTGNDSL